MLLFTGPLSLGNVISEQKFGLASRLSVKCNICHQVNNVTTSEQHRTVTRGPKAYDTNTRLALASLDNGIGFSHVNSILTALEIPSLTRSTYKKREREIGQATELVARESCEKMLIQESEMVKEKGVLADSDGLLPLSVSYDMGWSKRGKAHNSLTGHGAIMGSVTGKALDYTTRNKFCRTCLSAKKDDDNPNPHDCRLNHTMSSKSMEPESAVEMFKRVPVQGDIPVKYAVFIGDDDCSTISRIREEVSYQVEKWSDTVHAKRTLVNHLYKLKSERSFPRGESVLSNKVIEYFGKCFSYAIAQNAGNVDGLKQSIQLIVPHAFGVHENCKEWCAYKKDSATYKHKDLPYGKDLTGENLRKALEEVFEIYTNENVLKKIAQNASSQRNESLNSTIGSKNPKIRFYGGSESADQRVACAVAQKNLDKQYLVKTLETANITPGCIMNNQAKKMDYERSQDKNRKQSTTFKKRRRQLAKIRSSKNVVLESKEGTVYQSGSALSLDPAIINACCISKAEHCEIEKQAPSFCYRPLKKFQKFNANLEYNLVIFDTETNCGGKKAELVELAAICHNTGDSFTKFVMPKCDINEHASKINKFSITSFGNERILHRNGLPIETESLSECLRGFAAFLKSTVVKVRNVSRSKPVKTVLVGHNANVFDTPLLIRSINQINLVRSQFQELDLHFADSQTLARHLIKENNEHLRYADATVPKENLQDIYRCLFQSEFENAHEGLADVMALRKIMFQSKLALTTEDIVNNAQTVDFSVP